jgi:hypothetical protein
MITSCASGNRYEYGRIAKLDDQLHAAGVAKETIAAIMAGGETVRKTAKPEVKAAWLRGAMARMDELLDLEKRIAVREGSACCLGGKRDKLSKVIGKKYPTLEERIAAANETHLVFGHSVTRQPDGRVLVCFAPEGQAPYRCACLGSNVTEPISLTYCACCGGHIKHHLQQALGRRLSCDTRSSALASGQTQPCSFLYTLVD